MLFSNKRSLLFNRYRFNCVRNSFNRGNRNRPKMKLGPIKDNDEIIYHDIVINSIHSYQTPYNKSRSYRNCCYKI